MNKGFTKAVSLDLQSIAEDGTFKGYAAIFGNVDLGGDVIIAGAFKEWLSSANGDYPSVCWQHDFRNPIGVTTAMYEDEKGLYVEGKLSDTQQARDARILAKDGAIKGLSIGYFIKDHEYNTDGIKVLKSLQVYEYSFVTMPMNPLAILTSVKDLNGVKTVRDCEAYLRDELGFTHAQAKRFISVCKGVRDDEPDDTQMAALAAKLKSLAQV